MTLLDEAIARYHKLLENDKYKDLGWAEALEEQMRDQNLSGGNRAILPVLRPHFLSLRQYAALTKASETILSAIERVNEMALSTPSLLSRMDLLPAEKMLAGVDPGYPFPAVTSRLDTVINGNSVRFLQFNVGAPAGIASSEALAELFAANPFFKDFRKRYRLAKTGSAKDLLEALLEAYKLFGSKRFPRIAILESRPQFQSVAAGEHLLLAEFFRREGYPAEVVTPEQLSYRSGQLRSGDFTIDLVYRKLTVREFLLRFDLSHPLVRAYRSGDVCVVNSFRAELAHKKAIFDLLTDETITAGFPAAERRAIRQHVPWTRIVAQAKTTYDGLTIDLPEFILKNREKLVLKPNDGGTDQHSQAGWELGEAAWERAVRSAMKNSYVVQERVEPAVLPFPLLQFGTLEIRNMAINVHPHVYLGKVRGCSSWLSDASGASFSTLSGLAPTFTLRGK